MFCPKCGKQIDESDRFCRYCGNGAAHAPQQPVEPGNPVTIKNPYSGKNKQILGMLIFIVCVIAALAESGNDTAMWLSLLGAAIGLVIYLAGRVSHWYHAE
jgi:uncharacterized membrane protein YvbJ